MSYYQVAEPCRMPILDWNYKWDLSSSSLSGSKQQSTNPYFQIPPIASNHEQDLKFPYKLQSIKIEPPDTYRDYEGSYTLGQNSTKDKSTYCLPSNQTKFSDWSQNSRIDFDEYVNTQHSPSVEWSQCLEKNALIDKYVDFSQIKLENGTPSYSHSLVNDQYNDFIPLNQMKPSEWSQNPMNSFESGNFLSNSKQVNVNESFPDLNSIWSVTDSTIKQECDDDDDVRLLELYTPNNGQYKMDFYQSGLTENNPGRQFLNDNINDLSNDSVELLFERAGLDELMQSSPSQFFQIREFDDLVSDQPLPMDKKVKEEIIKIEVVNPITFNRKHYNCSYCEFSTNSKARLMEHMERLHSETDNSMRSTRRRQTRLRNSFDSEDFAFLERKSAGKIREKSFKCSECPYTTNHEDRLKRHINKKHFIEAYSRYNGLENDLRSHPLTFDKENINFNEKQSKSGLKPRKRPKYKYSANRNDRVKKHIAKSHSKNVCYKCNQCEYLSTYKVEYYEHMQAHYGGPPFRCDACTYKSKLITAFIAHRVTHTGDRLFNCTLCSFSCKRKYHLKGHMISHSKLKNFKCEQCGKRYSYKCSLVRHEKTSCKRKPTKQN